MLADENASVSGDQAAALKAGFEFAVALVMALETEPGMDEKLDVCFCSLPPTFQAGFDGSMGSEMDVVGI